jgi:hypothetical protein
VGRSRCESQLQTQNERPRAVRYRKADLSSSVKNDLRVEFTEEGLTSYAGLELLIRYFRSTGLNEAIRRHLYTVSLRGDYAPVSMMRLLLGLLLVGGRRLRHIEFLRGDPLVLRFCGLRRLPSARTVSRWLKNFKEAGVESLRRLNAEIVGSVVTALSLRTLSIDVDGTVLSTGHQVERAFRGFNPHHRKVPSYYPISAYVAETGHVLRVKNRSGNVHDGKASVPFLRDLFGQIDESLGGTYRLNFRMDGAFFRDDVISLLEARGAGFALKVPFWRCLDLQGLIRRRRRWKRITGKVSCFEALLSVPAWDRELRVVICRKRVYHRTRKNYQLDLFDPADGTYEYSAIATNLTWRVRRIWNFMCGRGAHEKTIGQLKSALAFGTIPTNHYGANSAWQQLVAIAHNLLTNFQLHAGVRRKPRTQKRTSLYELKSVQTLRFEILNRAGRIVRPQGRTILRLARNAVATAAFLKYAKAA